jgi:hypothetical protein
MINPIAREIIRLFHVNKFVETGIKEGDTLLIVSSWFSELYGADFVTEVTKHGPSPKGRYTIYEIDNDAATMHTVARIRQRNDNITGLFGDSAVALAALINGGDFKPEDSCFFYLDAHEMGGDERLAKQLTLELYQLKRLTFPFIVSIDDWDSETPELRKCGYTDLYGVRHVREFCQGRTDVIYETAIPNLHSKMSCFIFAGYNKAQLSPILRGLPLIETPL